MAKIVNDGHCLEGAWCPLDGFEHIRSFVNASVEPVYKRVAARIAIVEVLDAQNVAIGRKIDFHRIVTTPKRVPLHIAAIG